MRTLRALPKGVCSGRCAGAAGPRLQAAAGKERGGGGEGQGQHSWHPGHLLLELVGQEQELVPREPPDVELAEVLELEVDLLLAEPGPPADAEDEDGRSDTGVIRAGKVLEDKEKNRRRFPPFLLTT